jgi:hypothetical protein
MRLHCVFLLSGLLGASMQGGFFDPSTLPAKVVTIPQIAPSRKPMVPPVHSPNLREALQEIKSYNWSISAPFYYSVKGRSALGKGPIRFSGGSLDSFAFYIRNFGLFVDLKYGNTLVVSNTRTIKIPLWKIPASKRKRLVSRLRHGPGVLSVHVRGRKAPVVISTVTPKGWQYISRFNPTPDSYASWGRASGSNSGHALPGGESLMSILKRLYPYSEIPIFSGYDIRIPGSSRIKNIYALNRVLRKRYRSFLERVDEHEQGDDVLRFHLIRYRPIRLDQPMTVSDIAEALAKRTGEKFIVYKDMNVPVNPSVKIGKLEDLNRYISDTTGASGVVKRRGNKKR